MRNISDNSMRNFSNNSNSKNFKNSNNQQNTNGERIYSFNLNYSDYIELKTNISHENLSILVDSQADVCVIKQNSLQCDFEIDTSDIIEITGVIKTPIYSLGAVNIQIFANGLIITHKFHVMPNSFNIPSDGIIGRDFNRLYNCVMDYGTREYTIRTRMGNATIPIRIHTKNNNLTIPPRAETTRIFSFSTKSPLLVKAKELQPGVMTSNSIAVNGVAQIQIVNCTNQMQTIKFPEFETENLENYHIYTINKTENSEERTKRVLKILSKNYPNDGRLHKQLNKLCVEYSDIFALDTDKMTVNNFYEQKLRVNDNQPVFTRNYRTPHSQKQEINKQVQKLLDNDLIEHSISEYNSPVILVPKKGTNSEKKWRMCIDYRKLNKKLVADRHPLPRIDDILDNLGRAKYFSVFDLFSGFHQVPLSEESRNYTTFSTEKGSFRCKVLPFGLNVSPNSFSRMMSIAFSGLTPERVFLYIDDIIVIGRSEREHFTNIEATFQVLRKFNLKLNPEKCKFFQSQVTFLGHKCTSEGILPDGDKLKSVHKYPVPHDKDSVKRFVAFANYYRKFIPNFAEFAQPLTDLTRKRVDFEWTEKHQNAFERLKKFLVTPHILQYPDFEKEFIIKVDASGLGCAGVLLQKHDGIDLPVAYFSKTFQNGEKNKAIIEKELLAIYHSIIAFRAYVYNKKFTVYTDHKPLIYLFAMKNATSKLVRIRMELEEYDFDICYIRGKDNIQADALSRIPFSEIKNLAEDSKSVLAITRSMSRGQNATNSDINDNNDDKSDENDRANRVFEQLTGFTTRVPKLVSVLSGNELKINAHMKHRKIFEVRADVNEVLPLEAILSTIERTSSQRNLSELQICTNDKIFEYCTAEEFKNACMNTLKNIKIALIHPVTRIDDPNEQLKLIQKYHGDRIRGGHCGQKRLYAKLRNQFYWRGMTRDIAKYVKHCKECMLSKPKMGTREPMAVTPTPQKPFDSIIVDTIGPMPTTHGGNRYAITLICDLSKYLITIPIPNDKANTIAKGIFENFVLIYGTPKRIRTDRGSEYRNAIIKELCELLKVQHDFSTAYHHQTVGSIERNHRIFNEYIRLYSDADDWDVQLRYFTYCYNTSFCSTLNYEYTPFELVFGRKSTEIECLKQPMEPVYNFENYIKILKHTLQRAGERAKHFINRIKQYNKTQYDKKLNPVDVDINDLILVKKEPYDKFKQIYSGPYRVRRIDNQNITIEINNKPYVIHKNRIVKC